MNASEIAQLVHNARSCRRFVEADPIPEALLIQLVDIARLAPSSRNQQALRFLVVSKEVDRARIFPYVKWAAALQWAGPQPGERATGYIILLKPKGVDTSHDAGIAGMTIKLAAAAEGYASCMLGGMDRAGMHRELGLPSDIEIDIAIALGRQGENIEIASMPSSGSVAYWHDVADTHLVPKRALEELLFPLPQR